MSALAIALAAGAPVQAGAPRDVRDVGLIDQNGARFTLRELHRPIAVIFVASRCNDACPIAEALFAKLAAELTRERVDAQLLTITLDPTYDRPFVMAARARAFRADARQWRWASGDPDEVERLLEAFNVPRLDGRFHGAFAYVLDARALPSRLVLLTPAGDRQMLALLR